MDLNVNFARGIMFQQRRIEPKLDDPNPSEDTNTEQQQPDIKEETLAEPSVNAYTFFSVYDEVMTRLGNFYSETLAKMTGLTLQNKNFLNQLYNTTVARVVGDAIKAGATGKKIDFNELVQNVKEQITTVLESCNYDPSQLKQHLIDNKATITDKRFN